MHTSPAYAEDVYIGAHSGVDRDGHRATFVVPVNAPGVTVLCRKVSARHANPFLAPLSSRFDELDGQMWLDEVLVPWERVFLTEASPEPIASWCFWHQLYAWLAKAEFTLGLALACAHAMGLRDHEPTIEYLMDLVIDVQTVRSCQTAAELDPGRLGGGLLHPRPRPRGRGQHRHAEGAAAHGGDPADPARLLARGGAVGQGSGLARGGRRPRGVVRRAASTPRCSARPCSSWPPTTSPRRWTAASPRSSCTPTAGSWPGARGSGARSPTTTSSPTACCAP